MKPFVAILCLFSCAFGAVAQADVCQKDQPDNAQLRIRVVRLKDGSTAFLDGSDKNAPRIGGADASFSDDELLKKLTAAQTIVNKVDASTTVGAFSLLFAGLAIASSPDGRMIAASHDGPTVSVDADAQSKYPHAKELVDALNRWRVYPSTDCQMVDSLAQYKTELTGALAEVIADRANANPAPTATPALSDANAPKTVMPANAVEVHAAATHVDQKTRAAN